MEVNSFHLPTGSTLLLPVSRQLHIPLEQLNFVACQLFALGVAVWFRIYLNAHNAHATVRHLFATIIGVYFTVFCFGWYSLHIFIVVLVCYLIMMNANLENVHRYSFIVAFGYLILCQINRMYVFNYGILTTDFSGPLMIITQKIISLAFQLHDGMSENMESLTKEQLRDCVKKRPTLLQYLSYHLNFMSVLAGPCSNFQDYVAFIEGRHIHSKLEEDGFREKAEPSPNKAVLQKVCICVVSAILFLTVVKNFPISYVVDDNFINDASFLTRLGYLYLAVSANKPKYYFAWTLADAINNAAGYGFNGMDENGNPRWDLLDNINIWRIETSTSFKMYIDNWNIQAAVWFKRVCYDRAPKYRTALTFLISALWHGLYPGYYFTFITGIPVLLAGRAVRNNFRHYFISSKALKLGYDITTWTVTQLAVSYTCGPFMLLTFESSMKMYKSFYFFLHIALFMVLLILPMKPSNESQQNHHKKMTTSTSNSMKRKED